MPFDFRKLGSLTDMPGVLQAAMDEVSKTMRVACPGIIQSYDPDEMTVSVQPAIREHVVMDWNKVSTIEIPLLIHVPVVFPRAGDFIITFPIKPGDECLVVFGDRAMDAWWQSGGIQNPIEGRVHDLSDGYCILSPSSQPKKVSNLSTNSIQIRNLSGTSFIEITENHDINMVTTGNINVSADEDVTIQGENIYLN